MKKVLLGVQPLQTDLGILLLRLIFGGMFAYFGYGKLVGYNEILPMFGTYMGMGPQLSLSLVIFAEFGCGILVALGFLTRLSVIPIFITMLVAYFVAHANDPFDAKATAFVYMLLCVVIFVFGSGRLSLDGLIFKKV